VTFSFTTTLQLLRFAGAEGEMVLDYNFSFPEGAASALHVQEGAEHYMLAANYWDGASLAVDSVLPQTLNTKH
jgi:hypothetical protein